MARKRRRGKAIPEGLFETTIDSLTHDARGVAHIDGKATFIDGALPGETVSFRYTKCRGKYDEGVAESILQASEDRAEPQCAHALVCGGCSLQHLKPSAQVEMKQAQLLNDLKEFAQTQPETILPPLMGDVWGYRRKARLGVRYIKGKDRVLVGFREQRNRYLADLQQCEVLHPSVGHQLMALSDLVGQLQARDAVAQIEVAVSEDTTALVFRHLEPLGEQDKQTLAEFAQANQFAIYLQPGGVETIEPLWPQSPRLSYRMPDFEVSIEFQPSDFTQINASINQPMVTRAIELLELSEADEVLDLFCGLGNFTLPLACRVKQVTGVEGDAGLIDRARQNAELNRVSNTSFYVTDLFADWQSQAWTKRQYDKLLLDPPRSGARAVVSDIQRLAPQRIVYVSCHPGTLARDTGILLQQGYRLLSAGVMDMFPHTTHVESIAVFEQS